jgi:hypothetical protein
VKSEQRCGQDLRQRHSIFAPCPAAVALRPSMVE